MVKIPPLAPSARWFKDYFTAVISGKTEVEAVISANLKLDSSRDFGRYSLLDTSGKEIMLSVAVNGGGRQLRSLDKVSQAKLSEHGDWRKNHLGAIEACLGRKPFYPYIIERITPVYNDRSLVTLADFNSAIFNVVRAFLMGDISANQLKELSGTEAVASRGKEIADSFLPRISLLQYLSIFGRETLLGL